jgi:GT2 family glycosyltransferase
MQTLWDCIIMHDVTIILITWNARAYVENCLRSLAPSSSRQSTRVIVVDNNSSDGTQSLIEEKFRDVELIKNSSNVGFAGANNQAMRISHSRFVFLLNPDTIVRPGAVDALVDFMLTHEDAWACGPSILNGDGTPQRTGVRFPNNWNLFVESLFLDRLFPRSMLFGRHRALYEDPTRIRAVDYLQGACLMVRREVVENIGELDDTFFMYFEETDWCYRMNRAGGKVYICPTAQVEHLGGGDIGHYDQRRLLHFYRSLLLFYHKHYSLRRTCGARVIVGLRACIRILAWAAIFILKPSLRSKAVSSVKGYCGVFGMLFRSA